VRYFLVLFLLVSLAGCLPFRRGVSPGDAIDRAEPLAPIEPLVLTANETVIERFNPPGPDQSSVLELTLATTAQNVNPFIVTLTRLDYDLYLQDRRVSSGEFTPGLRVEANAQEPLVLALSAPLERNDLIKAAAQTFLGTPLSFRLEGTLSFSSDNYGFTTRKLVLLQGELTSRQQLELPSLSLTEGETRAFMLRDGVPVIRTLVQAENPGDVGYFLYGKDLEVLLNDVPLAKQDVSPVPVQAGQVATFELLFYPALSELGAEATNTLADALNGSKITLTLRGGLWVDVLGVDTFEVSDWSVSGLIQE
jgi:LEA14-like dessication related protein